MNIIITGALGHIGSRFIRDMAQWMPHCTMILVDNLLTQRYASLFDLPKTATHHFIEKDVRDIDWDHFLNNVSSYVTVSSSNLHHIDAVIHLAAITDAAGTADKPELVLRNNFDSTKKIADACLNADISFIFPSSTSVYGSQEAVVDEECQDLLPQSPYAECKINEEHYIRELAQRGLKSVICRLGTIYGTSPGMRFHTAVNKFCWQTVMGQPLTVWETALHQKRPYLALSDCSRALYWILEKKLYDGEIYNIVSNNFTVHDLLNAIKKHYPMLDVTFVHHTIMNQLSYEVLSDKFSKTGFTFKGDLSQGIFETLSLLKNANSSENQSTNITMAF